MKNLKKIDTKTLFKFHNGGEKNDKIKQHLKRSVKKHSQ